MRVLLVSALSVLFCMTASLSVFSKNADSSDPKPPIPPLADSCFNKTFLELFDCQSVAQLNWAKDKDQRQAFCCSTWEAMDCSYPYIEQTCNASEIVSMNHYFMQYEAYVIDYVKCAENLPGSPQCMTPPGSESVDFV